MSGSTNDFAFEMVFLTKSHPTLGNLHICYTVDVELPEIRNDKMIPVWYQAKWEVSDAVWIIR